MPESSPQTMAQLLHQAAQRGGDGVAVSDDGGREISWRELERSALAACRACIAAGLQHGDRAAIWAPNVFEWIPAALACSAPALC